MATYTPVILKDGRGNYVLPMAYQVKATANTLGSVRVGSGLNIDGDGILSTSTMTGASASSAGTSGYVPAPSAGDQDKFLKGDGTFSDTPSPSLDYNSSTETLTLGKSS